MFEEIRLSELRAAARLREREEDAQIAAAIVRWEARTGKSFHRHAAEVLTSDEERPVSETTVYDWQARRNGRRPPDGMTNILFAEDDEYNAWKNERAGFEPPRRKLPAGGDALARAYEAKLRGFGENGERAIAEGREEARRAELKERDAKHSIRSAS